MVSKKGFNGAKHWFWEFTSIGGIPQFRSSKTGFKWFWLPLFAAGLVGTAWNVYQVLDTYMQNRVSENSYCLRPTLAFSPVFTSNNDRSYMIFHFSYHVAL